MITHKARPLFDKMISTAELSQKMEVIKPEGRKR